MREFFSRVDTPLSSILLIKIKWLSIFWTTASDRQQPVYSILKLEYANKQKVEIS